MKVMISHQLLENLSKKETAELAWKPKRGVYKSVHGVLGKEIYTKLSYGTKYHSKQS